MLGYHHLNLWVTIQTVTEIPLYQLAPHRRGSDETPSLMKNKGQSPMRCQINGAALIQDMMQVDMPQAPSGSAINEIRVHTHLDVPLSATSNISIRIHFLVTGR